MVYLALELCEGWECCITRVISLRDSSLFIKFFINFCKLSPSTPSVIPWTRMLFLPERASRSVKRVRRSSLTSMLNSSGWDIRCSAFSTLLACYHQGLPLMDRRSLSRSLLDSSCLSRVTPLHKNVNIKSKFTKLIVTGN